ncbi:hypothetical protein KJ656_14580 [bacterium]|nr:hypothetical protein [bacterium]
MKTRKIFICLGMLFIFGIANFAMAKNNKANESNAPKLKLLKEIKIKENVRSLAIDKNTLKPKVYITDNGMEFLDKKGEVKKKYLFKSKNTKIVKSRNGKYLGVTSILEMDKKGGIKESEFSMLDANGNVNWKIKHKFWKYIPSPEGTYAIAMSDPEWGGAPIYLLNSKGEKKQISKEGANRASGPHFAISNSGNIIAVNIKQLRENPQICLGVVMDKEGNELWRRESDKQSCGAVPGDNHIATIAFDREVGKSVLSMYDLKGNLLWKNDEFIGSSIWLFSENSRYFFTNCALYDMKTGRLLWKRDSIYGDIFTTPNFELIAIRSAKWENYQKKVDTLHIFSRAGKEILYQEFPVGYIVFYESRPVVSFSDSGKEILISTSEGLEIFEIPKAE